MVEGKVLNITKNNDAKTDYDPFVKLIQVIRDDAEIKAKVKRLLQLESYRTIDFINDQVGWIAGESTLLKTVDGGETWQDVSMDSAWDICKIDFVNETVGWAVGTDTSYSGIILETEDGGNNWLVQIDGLSDPLNALHFKDGYGWAVGDNGLILRTENGATWVDQQSGKIYPDKFSLFQNYPNPFNPNTVISWQ